MDDVPASPADPDRAAELERAGRIRGPAGTGKTVAALHRTAYLATTRPGRVLFTGFVRTLPEVLGTLYRDWISPPTAGRVEFVGLHAWASRFLEARGISCRVDGTDEVWKAAWSAAGAGTRLRRLVPDAGYWREQVDHVIKARDLRDLPGYAAADRPGRRVPLQREHKVAVWQLYEEYQRRLAADRLLDHNDVLALAVREVGLAPPEPGYTGRPPTGSAGTPAWPCSAAR